MGLMVSVFHNPLGDATNNGISKQVKTLCLVNVDGPFVPDAKTPAAMLVKGNARGTVKIVPAAKVGSEWKEASGWWMMGGNFASTSDSRFSTAVERITGYPFYGAVAIHDRAE